MSCFAVQIRSSSKAASEPKRFPGRAHVSTTLRGQHIVLSEAAASIQACQDEALRNTRELLNYVALPVLDPVSESPDFPYAISLHRLRRLGLACTPRTGCN